jgi:hypothetical protein
VNWQTILILTLSIVLLSLVSLRVVKRIRRALFFLLILPSAILIFRWTIFRQAWGELTLALVFASIVIAIWWFLYGKFLAAPAESSIIVLLDDDPE